MTAIWIRSFVRESYMEVVMMEGGALERFTRCSRSKDTFVTIS